LYQLDTTLSRAFFRKGPPNVYVVEWCDHEGNLNQRTFDNRADAELEAASLEEEFGPVGILWETEV